MEFVRPLDDSKALDTGFPGYRAQIVSHLESSIFIASTIEAGGSGPALHYHESDQLYFLLRGQMKVRLVDEVHDVQPGSLVYIPAGTAHCNWNEGPGPETHLEAIIPSTTPGQQIGHPVDTPADVPPDRRAPRQGFVTQVDKSRLTEPLPGMHLLPLADPGMGVDRMVVNYTEVAPGGAGPGMHIHEFDQFYFVLEGELTIDVGLQHHAVGPDTLVLLPAGVPHCQYNSGDTVERHLAILTPAPVAGKPWDRGVHLVPNGDDHAGKFTRVG